MLERGDEFLDFPHIIRLCDYWISLGPPHKTKKIIGFLSALRVFVARYGTWIYGGG
jgi:hypothetical protein